MDKDIIFSLIIATLGRFDELEELLNSLDNQDFPARKFEVIIIDQNKEEIIEEIIFRFPKLIIKHIKSDTLGLSLNRNIGILQSQGKYICFPDDDCTYYPDTLSKAFKALEQSASGVVLGRIVDLSTNTPLIKNWPNQAKKVNIFETQQYATSITIFCKNNKLLFNENLGAGTINGSCEDLDYLFKLISNSGSATYDPAICVWHPAPEIAEIPDQKIISYGRGFGYFCRINFPSLPIIFFFFTTIAFHFYKMIISFVKLKPNDSYKRYLAIKSRIMSFMGA